MEEDEFLEGVAIVAELVQPGATKKGKRRTLSEILMAVIDHHISPNQKQLLLPPPPKA